MIEILVVLGLVGVIGGFALFVSMETFRGSSFHSDRDLLVAALQRARAESMNNTCIGTCTDGKIHGVAVKPADHPSSYVVFQTSSTYAGRSTSDKDVDSLFGASPAITPGGSLSEVQFSQLTGNPVVSGDISLTGLGKTSDIHIESEGRIYWSN